MAKTSVSDWDTTAANNTDIDGLDSTGATGLVKSGDNYVRSIMAQVASYTRHGADLATAATLDLDSVDAMFVNLTGTVTVTAVTLTATHSRRARAVGAFQLTASASLVVNGSTSTNYTTTAGDLLFFEGYGSTVVRVWALGGGVPFTAASAAGAASLQFAEDTDNGTSKATLQGAASLSGDITLTLPSSTGTLALTTDAGFPPGFIQGLGLISNGTDPANDIDIAAGNARDATNTVNMALAAGLTKKLDAAWAVGTNQGGLDTGSIANTSYFIWLIKRSDTGVVDVLFSASATAPTMPTNYDYKRRIGSFVRTGGAIRTFYQTAKNRYIYYTAVTQSTGLVTAGAAAITMPVPVGIATRPVFRQLQKQNAVGLADTLFADGIASAPYRRVTWTANGSESDIAILDGDFITNGSGQLAVTINVTGSLVSNDTITDGYYDDV